MKAFPDYEELNKDFYINSTEPYLSKRGFGPYSIDTRYVRIDNISYHKDSIINILDNKKGSLSSEDIKEIHSTNYLSGYDNEIIEKYYIIDIITNKVGLEIHNDEAVMFTFNNRVYMKLHKTLVRLADVINEHKKRVKEFLRKEEKSGQKLLMIVFNNGTIKLHYYNVSYDLEDEYDVKRLLELHDYKSKLLQDNEFAIENINNISLITVEKAIELELKLDFDTKTIEKLPLII